MNFLPPPQFESYQARSLQQQNAFSHKNNTWFSETIVKFGDDMTEGRLSARAVLELLSRRVTLETFLMQRGLDKLPENPFSRALSKGHTICSMNLERRGIDEDDDTVVGELRADPAASPLT